MSECHKLKLKKKKIILINLETSYHPIVCAHVYIYIYISLQ